MGSGQAQNASGSKESCLERGKTQQDNVWVIQKCLPGEELRKLGGFSLIPQGSFFKRAKFANLSLLANSDTNEQLSYSLAPEPERRTTQQAYDQSPKIELFSINDFCLISLPTNLHALIQRQSSQNHRATGPIFCIQDSQPFTHSYLWFKPALPPSPCLQ